ncbi:MAG: hypothetical protein U9Q15_00590 [Patescibacteria group bacterium]|nr:hypothetical protein [Patescibacteria group bacterium]
MIGSNIANLGSRKSDRYIKKDISYDVYIDADGQIYVSQRFLYKHNGEYNAFSTLYNGYQRTMIPFGAQMRSIYGSINNQDYLLLGDYNNQSFVRSFNLNKQHNIYEQNYVYNTLENYIEVAPDRETYFGYDYFFENTKKGNNGEDAMIDTYHLGVVKQPGSEQTYYHIEIKVPEGYLLQVENQNHQGYLREYVYTYDGELNSDFLLDLNIVRDTTPPIILDQKIGHDLREIQVYFDKDIDESSLFLGNIQIQDTDRVFPSKTDASIHPYKVEVISGKQLNIYVSGITDQPDEAYSIDIVGLQDVYENALTPDPHTITVIQNNFTF